MPLDVGQEAEVEHLVGLVEDERSRPGRELQVALLREVEQAAGGADDDVDALLERLDLRLVGAAAVDRRATRTPRMRPARLRGLRDLDAQLAGRDDDEGLGGP